jgi:type II secretory pathway pseudopilin PulG
MTNWRWTPLLLAALLLAGCTGAQQRERLSTLDEALRQFGAALRWARYMDAYAYVRVRNGENPPPDFSRYDNFRITSYEIQRSLIDEETRQAIVSIEIGYYHDAQGALRKASDKQIWYYEDETKRWYLDGDLPQLK